MSRKNDPVTYEGLEKVLTKRFIEQDKRWDERLDQKLVVQRKEFEKNIERYMGMLLEQFHHDLKMYTEHIPTIMADVAMLKGDVSVLKEDMVIVKGILGIRSIIDNPLSL